MHHNNQSTSSQSVMITTTRALIITTLTAAALACTPGKTCIQVYNKCPFPIWPGVQGSTLVANGGFKLNAGELKTVEVPVGWSAGRIWARTGCDGNFNCDTGFCGNSLECQGRGGEPPVSLAEFTLNANGQDYYDVSMVDGYNLPVFIEPLQGTFRSNGGQYDCKRGGGCYKDLNDPNICPPELQYRKNGRNVACKSACLAFNKDEYCCRGAFATPQTCNSYAKKYADIFKSACPTAYSYAYDDHTSTFVCRGNGAPSADYRVQFC